MPSSGVKTQTLNLSDIITQAYRECGIIAIVETPAAEQMAHAKLKINLLLSEWSKPGYRMWTIDEGILFLQKSQRRYRMGPSATDHYTDAYDYASTTLSAAAAAAATALTVTSITGIANADALGIELDTGLFQWTTVNGAPSGSTVTAAAGLTSAASAGNRVVAYTSRHLRPLEMSSLRAFNYADETEVRRDLVSHIDFMEQPSKEQESSPFVQARYQATIPQSIFEFWLTPADVEYAARYTYKRPIYDFTQNADEMDFPIEWGNALIFNLAADLIPSGNVPQARAAAIMTLAAQKLAIASGTDREMSSMFIQPDMEE